MNWNLIKEKYPKAEELADNWGDTHTIDWRQSDRWLYDFFDSQGIYVWITPPFGTDEGLDIFDGEIRLVNGDYLFERISICGTKTRTEAEEVAFLKAFEILEEKL